MNLRERLYIPIIWNKRKDNSEATKDITQEEKKSFSIELNEYNASLLICTLAFTCRYMYYGKVEQIRIEDYFDTTNFNELFYQLRLNMWVIHGKATKHFPNYKEFKLSKDNSVDIK